MTTTPINRLLALMEPEAAQASVDTLHNHGLDRLAQVSSAISLHRIANALEKIAAQEPKKHRSLFEEVFGR